LLSALFAISISTVKFKLSSAFAAMKIIFPLNISPEYAGCNGNWITYF
jgi:hypothetical protein